MHENMFKKEIQLKEDECCIVFDFGCYFPYENTENLKFDFQLGMKKPDDWKINHRYPNGGYQTISKKIGRKVSKLGYPYVLKLNEQGPMLLTINVGIEEDYVSLVFPLETNMTKEKPVCALTMRYLFDVKRFSFTSTESVKDDRVFRYNWLSEPKDTMTKCDIVLATPTLAEDSCTLVYQDVITPFASTIEKLCVFIY